MTGARIPSLRERWKAQVLISYNINDGTRVLLLAMADQMTASGRVSVPRQQLAATIGRSPAQVASRINAAVKARWLDRVRTGGPGVTAVYQAIFGDPFSQRVSSRPTRLDVPSKRTGRVIVEPTELEPARQPSHKASYGSRVTAGSRNPRANQAPSVDMDPACQTPISTQCERSERVAVDPDLPSASDTAAPVQSKGGISEDRQLRPPSRLTAAPREAPRNRSRAASKEPRQASEPVEFGDALTELFSSRRGVA